MKTSSMKKIAFLLLLPMAVFSQEKLQDNGIRLEKLAYPFPVKEITL